MSVSLHTSALAAQAHQAVLLPWLRSRLDAPSPRPAVVLVPTRADGNSLKGQALHAGINLCGVHVLTPGDVRDRLGAHGGITLRVPLREHLRLLLATAAELVNERRDDDAAAGVAISPDQLLKAIDLIGGSGWSFFEAGPARLRPVVAEFCRLLEGAGFALMSDFDRALLPAAAGQPPCFAELFVTGFNGLHWPLWPLLEAAVRTSASATVCLTDPRPEAEDLDAAWIGTWEQTFGAAQPVSADIPPSPVADLLRFSGFGAGPAAGDAPPAPAVEFLVGEDTDEQARAVFTKALQFLAEPACDRLGILFPSAGALSRRVALLLAEFDVPHHDGLAHHAPGPLEDAAWTAWLALQENPRLPALLRFLEARPEDGFAGLSTPEAAGELQRVFEELLLDDLAVIGEYLASHSRRHHAPALAEALQSLPFLPPRASLAEFIQRSDALFRGLGWTARAEELQRLAADWDGAPTLPLSRRSWLRWLGETLVSWRITRADAGRHPYSRLHLLPYAQAESQAWTHLIAAGLNEGQWPPPLEDVGMLGEEETDALNARLRALNTRAVTQGRQGEGHVAVESGKAFCLGPAQRRALAARQFFNTLESATIAVAASAQLYDESAPHRPLNPGEFFFHLYFHARHQPPGHDAMKALRDRTAHWLDHSGPREAPPRELPEARATRHAYDVRRQAGVPFGEYEFALNRTPQPPLRLAAKRWEEALASPGQVWLETLLGVAPRHAEQEPPWQLAQGNWVHNWMRSLAATNASQEFIPLPAPDELRARVHAAATGLRESVRATLAHHDHVLPDWWASAWAQALRITGSLVDGMAAIVPHTHAAVEWKLGDAALAIDTGTLHIRGRIDLLLSASPSLEDVWLIDYKTGKRRPLRTADLAVGRGIQLALYALALRAAGARTVGLSLLAPGMVLDSPQLTLADLDALPGLWRGLVRMQETAIFGTHGALRDEFGFRRDFPLATLAIDEEILAEKWGLTHPDIALEEEEEENL